MARRKPKEPTPEEKLAEAIKACAQGFRRMKESDLTEEAIVILIQHAAGYINQRRTYKKPTRKEIMTIINAGAELDKHFLKSCQEYDDE